MALVELFRETGEERYLEQARRFVDRRGAPALADIHHGRAYFQDDMPIRAAEAFRGHAVRALYLASGAVDVAVETDDTELLQTIIRQWERTIERRTYLTGGMGSRHTDESFGEDYELPPDRAYSETCAGVASVQLAWRLLLATGDVRYADLIERTLFNVVATSPALDGSGFFYANPLHQRVPGEAPDPDAENMRAASSLRAPWFHVSCCPTNVARTFASLSGYIATTDDGGVQIHQLMPSTVEAGGVRLRVITGYPWGDEVVVRIEETPESPVAPQPPSPVLGPRGRARRPRPPPPGEGRLRRRRRNLEAGRRGPPRAPDAPPLDSPGSAHRRRARLRGRRARPDRLLPRVDRPGRRGVARPRCPPMPRTASPTTAPTTRSAA